MTVLRRLGLLDAGTCESNTNRTGLCVGNGESMTAYEEAAFVSDLLMGSIPEPVARDLISVAGEESLYEALYADAGQLLQIARRLRQQTRQSVQSFRAWREQHPQPWQPIPQRYSDYEGILLRQHLRQHWTLYRLAMRELHQTRRRCDYLIDRKLGFIAGKKVLEL